MPEYVPDRNTKLPKATWGKGNCRLEQSPACAGSTFENGLPWRIPLRSGRLALPCQTARERLQSHQFKAEEKAEEKTDSVLLSHQTARLRPRSAPVVTMQPFGSHASDRLEDAP